MSKGGVVDYGNAGFITHGEGEDMNSQGRLTGKEIDSLVELTSTTPKPRAGEHVPCRHGIYSNRVCEICAEVDPLIAERDALRAHEAELVEALKQATAGLAVVANHAGATHPGCADLDNLHSVRAFALECFLEARSALAKHGR